VTQASLLYISEDFFLTGSFLSSIAGNSDLPIFSRIFSANQSDITSSVIKKFEDNTERTFDFVDTTQRIYSDIPVWLFEPPNINFELAKFPKSCTPAAAIQQELARILDTYHHNVFCYTDGSKIGDNVGCAYSINSAIFSTTLPAHNSVFTAELTAIYKCLKLIATLEPKNYTILSDSSSSLISLRNIFSTNPIVQRILAKQYKIEHATPQVKINYIWIPSHTGIKGNDLVDQAAKNSCQSPGNDSSDVFTVINDVKSIWKNLAAEKWTHVWNNTNDNKLRTIKNQTKAWKSSIRGIRGEEVVLTRLRIGHTRLMHTFLLQNSSYPVCHFCNIAPLTVKHLLTECEATANDRLLASMPNSLETLLNDDVQNCSKVIWYLKRMDLFKLLYCVSFK